MGKLKVTDYKNNYPLPPNQIFIEMVGEAIKIRCEGKNISLKTTKDFNHHAVETKIKFCIDTIIDCLNIENINR